MSLILEALKKSEARRQLGEAPGLGTPFTVARRRRSPLPIIVILVLAGAAFAWYYVRSMPRHAVTGETTAAQVPSAGPTVVRKPGAQATAAANPAATDRINAPSATSRPVAAAEPARAPFTGPGAPGQAVRNTDARNHDPRLANLQAATGNVGAGESGLRGTQHMNSGEAMNPVAAPRAAVQTEVAHTQGPNSALHGSAQPATGKKAEMRNAAAQTGSATVTPRPAVAPPVPALAPTSAPPATAAQTGIAAANPKPAAPPPSTAPAPAPAQSAPASAAAVAAGAPDMPLYYELPFNLRKDLPTLIVSMHVYAAVPAQRFVVIDGERKTEGETIKEGLTLREIRADGIVLEFRGQKFFYPRPGR